MLFPWFYMLWWHNKMLKLSLKMNVFCFLLFLFLHPPFFLSSFLSIVFLLIRYPLLHTALNSWQGIQNSKCIYMHCLLPELRGIEAGNLIAKKSKKSIVFHIISKKPSLYVAWLSHADSGGVLFSWKQHNCGAVMLT